MATPLDSGLFSDLVERAIGIQSPNRQEALAVLWVSASEMLSLGAEVARVRSFESNTAWTTRLPFCYRLWELGHELRGDC